ncbi:MAG: quinolinate synthase NadA [Bacteroidales bacterium]|nr:quinolinate synthase NadA [Bacteroidales bacterium]
METLTAKINLTEEINRLRREKNAVILAHYYQVSEIQDIADYVGDSLGLAQRAAETEADMIVFAGVHFMAETAKILNPNKKVVLPDLNAGCSLAESAPAEDFRKFKENYPDHKVVSYVNSTAAVKTMTDVVCTSSNAKDIVESFPQDQPLIFAPDKNLGGYINSITGRNMVLWEGTCEVHDVLSTEKVMQMAAENPDAKVIAHPECKGPVLELADFVGSTAQMLKFVKTDESKKYIVATETGLLYQMQKDNPEKEFLVVPTDETCACNDCPYMKMNTMDKLYRCMRDETPEIELSKETIEKAKKPIIKMLDLSRKIKVNK